MNRLLWKRDLGVALGGLAALLLWEALGWDLPLARLFGDARGFAWQHAWFTSFLLHDVGRIAAALALGALALDALRGGPAGVRSGPSRRARAGWLAVTIAVLLLVPALKHVSRTSCPWSLAEFGGVAAYVPHWRLGVGDGGPGRCFPSGHAVAAFAFFGAYFLWRRHRPRLARGLLAAVLIAGLVFGWAQLARGAHYASHVLWSAWWCWLLCSLADLLRPGLSRLRLRPYAALAASAREPP